MIWLGKGVYLDETGGHIDELACFTCPGHVALTWTDDRKDPQYEISQDAFQRLRHARDARGRPLDIHKIHQPGPLFMTAEEAAGIDVRAGSRPRRAGDRLPASYINFYIANKCVVMPLYDKRRDAAAMRTLRRLFPTRKVIGVADPRGAAGRRQYSLHYSASAAAERALRRLARNGTLLRATSRKSLFYAALISSPPHILEAVVHSSIKNKAANRLAALLCACAFGVAAGCHNNNLDQRLRRGVDHLEPDGRCRPIHELHRHGQRVISAKIVIRPNLKIASSKEREHALHLLKKAERLCLVSRTIDVPLRFEPQIEVTETVPLV